MTAPMFTRGFSFGMVSPRAGYLNYQQQEWQEGIFAGCFQCDTGRGEPRRNAPCKGKGRAVARPFVNIPWCADTQPRKPDLLLRWRHGRGLSQAEFQQRLARYLDLLALRQNLNACASRGTNSSANRRALAAPGNCADDRAGHRAAANFLCCI